MLVCTDPGDTEAGHADALTELARDPVVHRIRLAGLSPSDTIRLLEDTGRAVFPDLAARIVTQTEGNPLFAVEMGRLVATPEHDRHDQQALPQRILDAMVVVGHRSDACRRYAPPARR